MDGIILAGLRMMGMLSDARERERASVVWPAGSSSDDGPDSGNPDYQK